jgi:DNA replication factor GINS
MRDKTRINLDNILKVEREERKKLVALEADFYGKIADQIRELDDEKRKINDMYSTKYSLLEDELKTVRNAIESIIYKRTTKIINEARYNAEISLHAPTKPKENRNIDSMTLEERKFYDQLVELMTEWRGEVVNRIYRKEKPVDDIAQVHEKPVGDIAHVKEKPLEDIPQICEIKENTTKDIPIEDKKDISKEYIVVRLLKDIPTFVGVDGRNYTLAKEDVAVLSTVNAKALINRKAAIQMMVNR